MFRRYFENLNSPPRRSLVQTLIGDASPCMSYPKRGYAEESTVEWTWYIESGNDFVDTSNNDRDVTFHKTHSSGTAVVRGSRPMSQGQHFWEIEMISPVYGTDMMVGIGTPEADMSQLQNTFISRLGNDNHTWGFSYTGSFYHNGEERIISTAFDQGSVIGLHLDLWTGTLSFYKNHKYLGIASRGLHGKTLYAMASSTAACSSMRLLKSCSFPSSLQFLCCAKLRVLIPDDKCVLKELNIPPGLKLFLENNLSWLLNPRCIENHPHKDPKVVQCWENLASEPAEDDTLELTPGVNFIIVGSRGIPYTLLNHNRFQRRAPVNVSASESNDNEAVDNDKETIDNDKETVDKDNETVDNDNEQITSDDLSEDEDESDCKRRRYSYNYYIGLSDPDSE